MNQESIPGAFGETRAASTAAGGTALSTTAVFIELPDGSANLTLWARNFTTAVVAQFLKNPYLTVLKTTDLLATNALLTDYTTVCQDALSSTSAVLSALDTLANSNALYIGSPIPFGGINVVNANANANVSTLAVTFWNGTTFTTITPTDNTASGGATMAQSGTITWTTPTTWVAASLPQIVATAGATKVPSQPMFWVRLAVSAALSATVKNSSMVAINRSTAFAELAANTGYSERIFKGQGGIGCLQAKWDAGTASLIVNVSAQDGLSFTV